MHNIAPAHLVQAIYDNNVPLVREILGRDPLLANSWVRGDDRIRNARVWLDTSHDEPILFYAISIHSRTVRSRLGDPLLPLLPLVQRIPGVPPPNFALAKAIVDHGGRYSDPDDYPSERLWRAHYIRAVITEDDSLPLVALLLRAGADWTAASICVSAARANAMGTLDFFFDIHVAEHKIGALDLTPLMLACKCLHIAKVNSLLGKSVDPNAQDCNGRTALHHAASTYPPAILRSDVEDLKQAVRRRFEEIKSVLLVAGYDNTLKDGKSKTAQDLASEQHWGR